MLKPDPSWLNPGDTAWQITAATLVGIMSVPGLAILYAGLMKRKWAVNSSLMVVYAFAMTLVNEDASSTAGNRGVRCSAARPTAGRTSCYLPSFRAGPTWTCAPTVPGP